MVVAVWQQTIFRDPLFPSQPVLEKVLRTISVYVFLVAGIRLAGRRLLAQLNPFDLVVLLLLSNTVQNAIIGNDTSLGGGVLGASTLLATNWLLVRLLSQHRHLSHLVEGGPDVLVRHGHVVKKNLHRACITEEELRHAAERSGLDWFKVQTCILDPTGQLLFTCRAETDIAKAAERAAAAAGH